MGKVVAFVSVCAAWVAFCTQASPAFGMKADPLAESSPIGWEHSSVPVDPDAPALFHGTACLPGIPDLILQADGNDAYRADQDGWSHPFLPRVGAELFIGASREGAGLIYSIDPHTMCVSVLCDRHCASIREEWTVAAGSFPGSSSEQARSSSSGSQSGFMAVAGLTLIGLSGLRRNRVARAAARVYGAQEHLQSWKTRGWENYSAEKEPAYQTRAA